jgi:hypothetical protein
MNPYAAPQNDDADGTDGDKKRWRPSILYFVVIWPFFSLCINAVLLRSLRFLHVLLPVGINLIFVPPLFGYCVCIVAAARYPATISRRLLRGLGAVLAMCACGHLWRAILSAAFPRIW